MSNVDQYRQTDSSVKKNVDYFLGEHKKYSSNINSIDTYQSMSKAINLELAGINYLLDIGNGGVFDYDTTLVKKIVGVDLFLDALPDEISIPANVSMFHGSAMNLPGGLDKFDGVVMVMLLHHLVGKTVDQSRQNVHRAIAEAYRVLGLGGKFIIMESCVPNWFYRFEKLVFRPASSLIELFLKHPPTLQFPRSEILKMMGAAGFTNITSKSITKGKYVVQYGFKVPSFITPVQPVLFVGFK